MQLTYGPTVAAKGFPTSGAAADEQILLSTARAQAGRDAEMARLAQKASDATRKAEEKAAAASRERTRADGLARDLRLAQSAAVRRAPCAHRNTMSETPQTPRTCHS